MAMKEMTFEGFFKCAVANNKSTLVLFICFLEWCFLFNHIHVNIFIFHLQWPHRTHNYVYFSVELLCLIHG